MKELHIHLEGSVFPEAVACIAESRTLTVPQTTVPRTKNEFFETMKHYSREVLTCKADYVYAFTSLCARLQRTHDYAEITISPGGYEYYHGKGFEDILHELISIAERFTCFEVRFLVELLRNSGPDSCWRQLEMAAELRKASRVITGVNLGGDEVLYPTKHYTEHISAAKKHDLFVTVHAGEWGTADDVWIALDSGADRIGHGIRSIDDPVLVDFLIKKQVSLEVCPTSNLRTQASTDLSEIRRLAEQGVRLVINTDDPAVFGINLQHELTVMRGLIPTYRTEGNYRFSATNDLET